MRCGPGTDPKRCYSSPTRLVSKRPTSARVPMALLGTNNGTCVTNSTCLRNSTSSLTSPAQYPGHVTTSFTIAPPAPLLVPPFGKYDVRRPNPADLDNAPPCLLIRGHAILPRLGGASGLGPRAWVEHRTWSSEPWASCSPRACSLQPQVCIIGAATAQQGAPPLGVPRTPARCHAQTPRPQPHSESTWDCVRWNIQAKVLAAEWI